MAYLRLLLHLTLVVVAVYILSKQSDLFDSFVTQVLDFVNDGRGRPVSLSTPNEGYNAEAAHIVAPTHNTYPSV